MNKFLPNDRWVSVIDNPYDIALFKAHFAARQMTVRDSAIACASNVQAPLHIEEYFGN